MDNEVNIGIRINAAPEEVWEAITNSEKIQKLMFGARARSDWRTGSKADYYIQRDGKKMLTVKGCVTRASPPFYLEHTLFPAESRVPDQPENYLTAIYEIMPFGEHTELNIIQKKSSFVSESETDQHYDNFVKSWESVLPIIKEVAEARQLRARPSA